MLPNKPKKLLDDCFLHDKDRLRHEHALELIKTRLSPIAQTHMTPLVDAPNRFLAGDINSPINIPSTDNSAVDGYAFAHSDYEATGGFFPVVARIAAGDINSIELPQNTAARIFTGAVMPQGADTIAMQEDCETHKQDGANMIIVPPGLKQGANRRRRGEDVKTGETVASIGERISPTLLAAIASTGANEVSTFKKLKIGLISSGDELIRPGTTHRDGQVYDSNHFQLRALLAPLPVEISDYGIIPDDYETTKDFLKKAADECDIIISSGGASRGEEDHIINVLENIGKRHLWQLAVKPGRPMSMGQIQDTVFFGLPGNPVACFVCFLLYVRQAIILLGGGYWKEPKRFLVPVNFDIQSKKTDRREFGEAIISNWTTDHMPSRNLEETVQV